MSRWVDMDACPCAECCDTEDCIDKGCMCDKAAQWQKGQDLVNPVRCKECAHWGTGVSGETENVKCCEYGHYMVGQNGYCVYGQKAGAFS